MYQERTCNPLWPTFGCKTSKNINPTGVTTAPTDGNPPAASEAWYNKYFGWFNAEEDNYADKTTDSKILTWCKSLFGQ
jgi:hypothetical protein